MPNDECVLFYAKILVQDLFATKSINPIFHVFTVQSIYFPYFIFNPSTFLYPFLFCFLFD